MQRASMRLWMLRCTGMVYPWALRRHSLVAEFRSPFKGSASADQFLPLPATAFVCLTFAVCRVVRRTYIPARPVCNVGGPEPLRLPDMRLGVFLLIPMPTVGAKRYPPSGCGRGSSRETTMTSSARLAAAVICMSAVVACSRTERTVIQPATAPATVVTPAPAGTVVTTQPAPTTVYTTR